MCYRFRRWRHKKNPLGMTDRQQKAMNAFAKKTRSHLGQFDSSERLINPQAIGLPSRLPLDFLAGRWKIEGKAVFEVWEKTPEGLKGRGYYLEEQEKKISEHLEIKSEGEQLVYSATVSDQNDGRTIPFRLTESDGHTLVFENPEHDFPQKIVYRKVSEDKVNIFLSGIRDKQVSFNLLRQRE